MKLFTATIILFLLLILTGCGGGGSSGSGSNDFDCGTDTNCDGQMTFAFLGDSIVAGVGDNISGGYVTRLQSFYPNANLQNHGIPGITTNRLLAKIKQNSFSGLENADYVFVGVGINDYFEKQTASQTATLIKRITIAIRELYESSGLKVPVIKVMTITPTTRSYQRPFVNEVNALLLKQGISNGPRFDKLNSQFISSDGIHPIPAGYQTLAEMFKGHIQ